MEQLGFIADGALSEEKIFQFGKVYKKDEAKTRENYEKCSKLYKPDSFDCDAAWEIYKCFH